MNVAIILSGGVGTRFGSSVPKQYLEVNSKPIIMYSIEKFDLNKTIDEIVIVVAKEWEEFVKKNIELSNISKRISYAPAGVSRQNSIYNGLIVCKKLNNVDNVIIHDAARPCVSQRIITECMENLNDYDGVMPCIPVKDTIYLSRDGNQIHELLNRDELYAGQAPEAFKFKKYLDANESMITKLESIRGSSELAFKCNMSIKIIKGEERNFKITTVEDLSLFEKTIVEDK